MRGYHGIIIFFYCYTITNDVDVYMVVVLSLRVVNCCMMPIPWKMNSSDNEKSQKNKTHMNLV